MIRAHLAFGQPSGIRIFALCTRKTLGYPWNCLILTLFAGIASQIFLIFNVSY
jgi:hypothetical protein